MPLQIILKFKIWSLLVLLECLRRNEWVFQCGLPSQHDITLSSSISKNKRELKKVLVRRLGIHWPDGFLGIGRRSVVMHHLQLTVFFSFKNLAIKRSRNVKPPDRFVYVDTAQLEENHEFELQKLESDQVTGSGNKSFRLKLLEHPRGKVCLIFRWSCIKKRLSNPKLTLK